MALRGDRRSRHGYRLSGVLDGTTYTCVLGSFCKSEVCFEERESSQLPLLLYPQLMSNLAEADTWVLCHEQDDDTDENMAMMSFLFNPYQA